MDISDALTSLENSWSREDVLLKIKNGANSEKIIDEFLYTKREEIEALTNFINPEDNLLLSEIEEVANIESKLINKIKNHTLTNNQLSKLKKNNLKLSKKISNNIGFFIMKWCNKFVFISLLIISAIALTKQAWS